MHRNLPTVLWFQMKLKTREPFSRVSLLGFSVSFSSRSQPLLRDVAEAVPGDQADGWEPKWPPGPSKAAAVGLVQEAEGSWSAL